MKEDDRSVIWQSTMILTIAAFLTKILSVGYRVPYQNIAGDIGFYVYQQVYPFYGILLILAMYGFPVIISAFLSEYHEQEAKWRIEQVIVVSFWTLTFLSLLCFFGLFFGAEKLSVFIGDPKLVFPFQSMSLAFLFMPFLAVMRGAFQGKGMIKPTAVSQVFEQVFRVITIVCLSLFLIYSGSSPYLAGAGAAFGSFIGGLAGVIALFIFYRQYQLSFKWFQRYPIQDSFQIVKRLLIEGSAVCISALSLSAFQLVDSLIILSELKKFGMPLEMAKLTKGIFDRGQPLLQFGTVLATSLALAIVPMMTKAKLQGNNKYIREKTSLALKISFIVGTGAAAGLAAVIRPTNIMLFKDHSLSVVLGVLGVTILFTSIAMTAAGILQGLGFTYKPAKHVVMGIVIKAILTIILIPFIGIMGAALGTVLGFAVIAFLNIMSVQRETNVFLKNGPFHSMRILISMLLMVLSIFLWQSSLKTLLISLESERFAAMITSLTSVIIGGSIYLLSLLYLRVFSKEELLELPKGDKLVVLYLKLTQKGA
ncbi:putative polysaccharide biosynthesis protein [Bacillus taeanensis]|nr:polysaccharide biosynthesis protein [Bacillus taeanensis]